MRTSSLGAYAFKFARTGVENAIYFVSSSYGGVAYFTSPLRGPTTTGDDAEITVFDTTSRLVPISVRGHHLIVNAPVPGGDGDRHVTEVYELSNDSSVTRVLANETPAGAVWTAPLPNGAKKAAVAEGDIPAAAVKFVDGQALVYAPLAPGVKQLVLRYDLPAESFPLAIPLKSVTGVMEVLLEEPNAVLRGVREVEPVALQGRRFRRFLGADISPTTKVVVTVPETGAEVNPWFVAGLTVVIGGAMTVALARAVRRR
jgi:hypothetical protein